MARKKNGRKKSKGGSKGRTRGLAADGVSGVDADADESTDRQPVIGVSEEPPNPNGRVMLIGFDGDMFEIERDDSGERVVNNCTSQYNRARRARLMFGTVYHACGIFANKSDEGASFRLVMDANDPVIDAKVREGYDKYTDLTHGSALYCPVFETYEDFWKMTKEVVDIWNGQISSDGRGFVSFLSGHSRDVSLTTIMPCHPYDALMYLKVKEKYYDEIIVTDILDNFDSQDACFVGLNNRMFCALFMDYKCLVPRAFGNEDITHADKLAWTAGSPDSDEDEEPLQKSQLSQQDIAVVAKMLECSTQKSVRLLKASRGDVLGALANNDKDQGEEDSLEESILYRRARVAMYIKLVTEGLTKTYTKGLSFSHIHPEFDEETIWMHVDESMLGGNAKDQDADEGFM